MSVETRRCPTTDAPTVLDLDALWVVWSFEHDSWWASGRCGYVRSLLLAGTYSEAEAKEIEEGANYPGGRNEEAAPLTAALETEYARWGRRGGMVIDALLAAARRGGEDTRDTFTADEVMDVYSVGCWDGGSVNRPKPGQEARAATIVRRAMDARSRARESSTARSAAHPEGAE